MFDYSENEIKWLKDNEHLLREKKSRSKSGKSVNYDLADLKENVYYTFDLDQLKEIGGEVLVVFYLCGSNYQLAAKELKIKENNLRQKIHRIGKKIRRKYSKENFIKVLHRKS